MGRSKYACSLAALAALLVLSGGARGQEAGEAPAASGVRGEEAEEAETHGDAAPPAPPAPAPAGDVTLTEAEAAAADEEAAEGAGEETETEAAEEGEEETPFTPRATGSFWTRVRTRHTSRESDQDVFSGLLLTLTPREGLELHFKGDLFVDAGRETTSRTDQLFDLWDTWDSSAQGRLQEAYARMEVPVLAGLEVRAGRQAHFGNQALHFDGLWAALDLSEAVTVRAYGGVPVFFYKSPWRGDVLGGAALDLRPTRSTELTLEYLHVTERPREGGTFRHDDLFAASARQAVGGWLVLRARGEVLKDEVRSAEGSATVFFEAIDLQLRGRYYVLFDRQQDLTTELDPFSETLGPENPYQTAEASLFQGIAGVVGVELFYAYRDVVETRDEGLWNHDFHRYGAGLHVYDVPLRGLTLSVTCEAWDVEGRGGADTRQVSGEVDYRVNDVVRVSAGSTYLLYRYDLLARRTREDVRLYFARLRLTWDGHRVDLAYEYEHDDLDDFHTARVGYRHDF